MHRVKWLRQVVQLILCIRRGVGDVVSLHSVFDDFRVNASHSIDSV